MSRLTHPQLLFIARQHCDAGRAQDAEGLCRRVLADAPEHADAWRLLGLIYAQTGRPEVGVQFIARALRANPQDPAFHVDLARTLCNLRRFDDAVAPLCEALTLRPDDPDILAELAATYRHAGQSAPAIDTYRHLLALRPEAASAWVALADLLSAQGSTSESAEAYHHALGLDPNNADTHYKLGCLHQQCNNPEAAEASFHRALELAPRFAPATVGLGLIQHRRGNLSQAITLFLEAVGAAPNDADAYLHLGDALLEIGSAEEGFNAYHHAMLRRPHDPEITKRIDDSFKAVASLGDLAANYKRRLAGDPNNVDAHYGLAHILLRARDLDGAGAAYRRVLELRPDFSIALNNMAVVLKEKGRLDDAITYLRRAVAALPDDVVVHSNLVYMLHFHPDADASSIHQEHRLWNERHAARFKSSIRPHQNDPSPDRQLRIGYVSPDFRRHPVGRFLLALFAAHQHQDFHITAYSSGRPDDLTAQIQKGCDAWVDVRRLSHRALAERIREDGIDILVDLTMHMADNRMLAFARQPAPVQVTYLAYCSTTGLDTIDYRITDPHLDPLPATKIENQKSNLEDAPSAHIRAADLFPERPLHLPTTYWCYEPGAETPPVNALPALRESFITFASLNNFCKVSPAALRLWARLLQQTPNSRLLLHACPGNHRQEVLKLFRQHDVAPERVRFFDRTTALNYFRIYHAADIALDPFPYVGGTTTCDALWMGVPVISLVGREPWMRSGLSILTNIGMPEFAVASEAEYLRTAVALAQDVPRLAELRRSLRRRLRASPLMDASRFAREMEALYRRIWRDWCGAQRGATNSPHRAATE